MMNSFAKVSVCITTYNQAPYIARCIESAISQLPPGQLEILVGDDGSTDGSRELITELALCYPGIVKPLFTERNLGPSGNLRHLIGLAEGQFIAHLDGDDYWLPGKVRRQLAAFDSSPHASAVLTNALVVDKVGTPLGFFSSTRVKEIDSSYLVARGNFLCHSSLLYRREQRDEILAIPGKFIDYMILVRLAKSGPLAYVDEALVGYCWNAPTSMRAVLDPLVGDNYWTALIEGARSGASRAAFRGGAARFFERILAKCILQGRFGLAYGWVCRMRRESPCSVDAALFLGSLRVPLSLFRHLRREWACRGFRDSSVFYRR
jgi:glycosyltransferase involved in cell wall biosynthesis